jgi:DNA-binding MarR family transcriptional regulator
MTESYETLRDRFLQALYDRLIRQQVGSTDTRYLAREIGVTWEHANRIMSACEGEGYCHQVGDTEEDVFVVELTDAGRARVENKLES